MQQSLGLFNGNGQDRKRDVYYEAINNLEIETESEDVETSGSQKSLSLTSLSPSKLSSVHKYTLSLIGICLSIFLFSIAFITSTNLGAAWASKAAPFSIIDPQSIGFRYIDRPESSRPGDIFKNVMDLKMALPTNSWCENFFLGSDNNEPENKVFQLPYIIDTAGPIVGLRTHPAHMLANDRQVQMNYELENGLSLGATEAFAPQHRIQGDKNNPMARLAIVLEWESESFRSTKGKKGSKMSAPIVRGAPYTSMQYFDASPYIVAERFLSSDPLIDQGITTGDGAAGTMTCGQGLGIFGPPFLVTQELELHFDTSDMTWLVFTSEPMMLVCSNYKPIIDTNSAPLPPGVLPESTPEAQQARFEVKAVAPCDRCMLRIAMANNCTTGQNPQYCDNFQSNDQTPYTNLLRAHADTYPTGQADIEFTFPVQSGEEEILRLNFNWHPASMRTFSTGEVDVVPTGPSGFPKIELLMYATPHHMQRIQPVVGSSNKIQETGCMPTIHGHSCPVSGGYWSMLEHLHKIGFQAETPIRPEMVEDVKNALKKDIQYRIPANYMKGDGDTYFSGKMLAKLARILIIADSMGVGSKSSDAITQQEFDDALDHLRAGVTIWLNGKAGSPLLYDALWGGLVMCGCDYNGQTGHCNNRYPDCPALVDAGSNFGAGFYNDHHYHFGYHIYAAAVMSKFDNAWGRKYYEHVLMLIRDIANPSTEDPFFPTFRHKDWYLGFSWASGIVTIDNKPYPNGRNQESSSEAISAYEAVALFGDVFTTIYGNSPAVPSDGPLLDASMRIRDMGRLLLATEIRSAKTYWHVQQPFTSGVTRVYPSAYQPKVIGMIWSMLAQEQTWFGNEPWKSYGIQLMPLTVAAEQRDAPSWIREMIPHFNRSCMSDSTGSCVAQGWSILIESSRAVIGDWEAARDNIQVLPDSVFEAAGGNGHSRSNTLWYVATRPELTDEDYDLGNMYPF